MPVTILKPRRLGFVELMLLAVIQTFGTATSTKRIWNASSAWAT